MHLMLDLKHRYIAMSRLRSPQGVFIQTFTEGIEAPEDIESSTRRHQIKHPKTLYLFQNVLRDESRSVSWNNVAGLRVSHPHRPGLKYKKRIRVDARHIEITRIVVVNRRHLIWYPRINGKVRTRKVYPFLYMNTVAVGSAWILYYASLGLF